MGADFLMEVMELCFQLLQQILRNKPLTIVMMNQKRDFTVKDLVKAFYFIISKRQGKYTMLIYKPISKDSKMLSKTLNLFKRPGEPNITRKY